MNCNENKQVVRDSLTFEELKELCVSYEKIMKNDFSIQKVHFLDMKNGKITIFYEDNKEKLYSIRELPYHYPDCDQISKLLLVAKEIFHSSTISTQSRYENAPCFSIIKTIRKT